MRNNGFYKKRGVIFLLILFVFFALIMTKVLFFNEFGCDDGDGASIALSILKGKIVNTFQGNFLGTQNYFLFYPPLYMFFLAVVFKIFGATYLTSKLVAVTFAFLLAVLVCAYCYRRFGVPIGPFISALVLYDYLLFSFAYLNRTEMVSTLFFTIAVLLFLDAEAKKSWKLMAFAGASSGAAMLSSYNCNWLFIAFFGYVFYLACRGDIRKNIKNIAAYLISSFIVMGPWYLWVLLNAERRSLLFIQVLGQSSSVEGYAVSQIIRKLLNPLADLYLVTFRYYSSYSIIVVLVLIYFLFNLKKYFYPFLLISASILMMFFNHRAAHYFVITLPICYILFGFCLEEILSRKHLKPAIKAAAYILLISAVTIGIFNDARLAFKESDIKLDSKYYGDVIRRYTEEGSCVAVDPVFALSDYGNRKLVQAGLLIWEGFRKSYKNYNEVVEKVAGADYLILTERQKKWGELPVEQSVEFQKYIKERCLLTATVDDGIHGRIWIYKCER